MKEEIKKKWLDALRSGEYVQGYHRLRRRHYGEIRYCCLGVLTDLFVIAHSGEQWTIHNSDGCYDLNGEAATLPYDVMTWAGIDNPNPLIKVRTGESGLADQNDMGMSFDKIAELIEAQL